MWVSFTVRAATTLCTFVDSAANLPVACLFWNLGLPKPAHILSGKPLLPVREALLESFSLSLLTDCH